MCLSDLYGQELWEGASELDYVGRGGRVFAIGSLEPSDGVRGVLIEVNARQGSPLVNGLGCSALPPF